MTTVPGQEPPLSRSGLGDELDRTLRRNGMKADVGDLESVDCWIVAGCGAECVSSSRAHVAVLIRYVAAQGSDSRV